MQMRRQPAQTQFSAMRSHDEALLIEEIAFNIQFLILTPRHCVEYFT